MKSVEIDRGKRLRDQPTTGHNRFHPDIPPLVTVDEGEEVVLATRDGVDGQLGPGTTEADIAKMDAGAIHPRLRQRVAGTPVSDPYLRQRRLQGFGQNEKTGKDADDPQILGDELHKEPRFITRGQGRTPLRLGIET